MYILRHRLQHSNWQLLINDNTINLLSFSLLTHNWHLLSICHKFPGLFLLSHCLPEIWNYYASVVWDRSSTELTGHPIVLTYPWSHSSLLCRILNLFNLNFDLIKSATNYYNIKTPSCKQILREATLQLNILSPESLFPSLSCSTENP